MSTKKTAKKSVKKSVKKKVQVNETTIARMNNAEVGLEDEDAALAKDLPNDFDPIIMKQITDMIEGGISLTRSIAILGVETKFKRWRKKCPKYFDREVERADSRLIGNLTNKISLAGDKYWAANAWLLERRFKSEFSTVRANTGKPGEGNIIQVHILTNVPRPPGVIETRGVRLGELKKSSDRAEIDNDMEVQKLLEAGEEE